MGQYSKTDNETSKIMFDSIKWWFTSEMLKASEESEEESEESEGLKTPEETLQTKEDIQSSITYCVKLDGQIYMDVHLADYEEQTLDNFAKVIAGLSSLRFQMQTIEMIKDSLVEVDEIDVFNTIVEKMVVATQDDQKHLENVMKDRDQNMDSGEEQPWIKPSQVMK